MMPLGEIYGKLPLYFEANRGQTDSRVRFLSRGPGRTLFLTATDAILALTKSSGSEEKGNGRHRKSEKATGTVIRLTFLGANPHAQVAGREELPSNVNYFIGNDPKEWHTNVSTYAKVQYENIYPGIRLTYYGNQGRLECDFLVRPGADPRSIVLGIEGAEKLGVDSNGDLVLHTALGTIRQQKPFIYQEVDGARREISGSYLVKNNHRVGFRLAAYDARMPLVIDPVLFYSTYLGGSNGDTGQGIAVDSAGNAYVTGYTTSANFPTTVGAFQTAPGGRFFSDAFVTKLNPTGSGVIYSTYLGGTGDDAGMGIAVDALGNAYVTGGTDSTNFPTTSGAFQIAPGGGSDAFVTKLNPTGSGLIYSTYLGGSGQDYCSGIVVDTSGNVYLTGATTAATNFPTTAGAFHTAYGGGPEDAFVTKLNPTGSGLIYSTYLGGNNDDLDRGIAVDSAGNAYVTGFTKSTNFPTTVGAFQTAFGGGADAFVTKLNPTGSGLIYSTYLGGSGTDGCSDIAVDTSGNAYVTGGTTSTDFPTTAGAFQTALVVRTIDAFVTKLNPTGSALIYSTYLGGNNLDQSSGIAVDSAGNAYVTGSTDSTDFPTMNAIQAILGGNLDAFVTVMNPLGNGLVYSSYLGGSGDDDEGVRIALDSLPNPNAYVTGFTNSTNFPTTSGAFQIASGGGYDGFVTKIANITLPPSPTVGKVTGGGTVYVSRGLANFGFSVRAQSSTGSISGDLQYVNHASGANVHSLAFTTLVISGNTATFIGTCTNNSAPCTFVAMVKDNGEPGTSDTFTISIDAGPPQGGTLRSGNIQIHQVRDAN
jgi:hypothetical protein